MKQLVLLLFIGLTLSVSAQEKTAVDYNNEGNEFVRNKDYKSAYESYSKAIELNNAEGKIDTNLIYNAGYCAFKASKYDEALPLLQQSIEFNYKEAMPYIYIGQIYSKDDKYDVMEKVLLEGIGKYPDDKNLNKLLASCYLKEGLVYFNEGNDIKSKANSSGLNESDPEAFKAEYAKADEKFKVALPYFEKSYKYNAENKSTLKALENVYTNLGMTEEVEKIKAELAKME